jgi:hypothetical protein
MADSRYKELDEAIIRLAITLNPNSENYKLVLEEGKAIRHNGSEPIYFLDTEEQSVLVLDYNDVMENMEEEATVN